jgi:hypothetical protein
MMKYNPTKSNYEPIIFHNTSQLNDQIMLELTPMEHDTERITQYIKPHGENDLYL